MYSTFVEWDALTSTWQSGPVNISAFSKEMMASIFLSPWLICTTKTCFELGDSRHVHRDCVTWLTIGVFDNLYSPNFSFFPKNHSTIWGATFALNIHFVYHAVFTSGASTHDYIVSRLSAIQINNFSNNFMGSDTFQAAHVGHIDCCHLRSE